MSRNETKIISGLLFLPHFPTIAYALFMYSYTPTLDFLEYISVHNNERLNCRSLASRLGRILAYVRGMVAEHTTDLSSECL